MLHRFFFTPFVRSVRRVEKVYVLSPAIALYGELARLETQKSEIFTADESSGLHAKIEELHSRIRDLLRDPSGQLPPKPRPAKKAPSLVGTSRADARRRAEILQFVRTNPSREALVDKLSALRQVARGAAGRTA